MKNLKKALALVLAMSVVTLSGSALAAVEGTCTLQGGDATFTASYDASANSLTATATGAKVGEQMTFLILDAGTDVANIAAANILYIDQKEAASNDTSFTGVINLARVSGAVSEMPEGTYPVRFGYYNAGGTFQIGVGNLVITAESTQQTKKITLVLGDVNADAATNLTDASQIMAKLVGGPLTVGTSKYQIGATVVEGFVLGDVNADAATNLTDASQIMAKLVGGPLTVGTSSYQIGQSVELTVPIE